MTSVTVNDEHSVVKKYTELIHKYLLKYNLRNKRVLLHCTGIDKVLKKKYLHTASRV